MREDGGLSVDAGEGIFIIMYQNNFTREDYYNHPSQTKTNIEKLNQFLESCNKTNADLRKRSIEEDNDTREDVCAIITEEKRQCVICKANYHPQKDEYNWISGGIPCCSSPVHFSCLVQWRLSGKRTTENELIVWCPSCTPNSYIPAVWVFDKAGSLYEKILQDQDEIFGKLGIKKQRDTIAERMETEKPKLNILTTTSEMIEKKERDGLKNFIENYTTAKFGKYPDIPPLNSIGNRDLVKCKESKFSTDFENYDNDDYVIYVLNEKKIYELKQMLKNNSKPLFTLQL